MGQQLELFDDAPQDILPPWLVYKGVLLRCKSDHTRFAEVISASRGGLHVEMGVYGSRVSIRGMLTPEQLHDWEPFDFKGNGDGRAKPEGD